MNKLLLLFFVPVSIAHHAHASSEIHAELAQLAAQHEQVSRAMLAIPTHTMSSPGIMLTSAIRSCGKALLGYHATKSLMPRTQKLAWLAALSITAEQAVQDGSSVADAMRVTPTTYATCRQQLTRLSNRAVQLQHIATELNLNQDTHQAIVDLQSSLNHTAAQTATPAEQLLAPRYAALCSYAGSLMGATAFALGRLVIQRYIA